MDVSAGEHTDAFEVDIVPPLGAIASLFERWILVFLRLISRESLLEIVFDMGEDVRR